MPDQNSIRLFAEQDGRSSAKNQQSDTFELLDVVPGKVTFKLSSDVKLKNAELSNATAAATLSDDGELVTWEITVAEDESGEYTATAKDESDQDVAVPNTVKLRAKAKAAGQNGNGAGEDGSDAVSQVSVGAYDPLFTYFTLIFVIVAIILVTSPIFGIIAQIKLPPAGAAVPSDHVVDGTFRERIAGIVLLLGTAVGIVAILFGAWQAALETRGRLEVRGASKGGAGARGVLDKDTGEAIGKIVEQFRRLRGTVATILAGGLLVALAMVLGMLQASPGSAPEPSPTAPAASAETTSEPNAQASGAEPGTEMAPQPTSTP